MRSGTDQSQSGIVFGYRNDRVYDFAKVVGQMAITKKVNHGVAFRKRDETVLAAKPWAWKPGEFLKLRTTVPNDHLSAESSQDTKLEARDAAFKQGKIRFTSDVRTRFGMVRVTCSAAAKATFEKQCKARTDQEARTEEANLRTVVWWKLSTPSFGVGRNLRFGDLDGDGRLDILVAQVIAHGPSNCHCEVG